MSPRTSPRPAPPPHIDQLPNAPAHSSHAERMDALEAHARQLTVAVNALLTHAARGVAQTGGPRTPVEMCRGGTCLNPTQCGADGGCQLDG